MIQWAWPAVGTSHSLTNQDRCPTPRTAARPIPEGMTVLRLGQYSRPSLATAGLLVNFDVRAICRSGLSDLASKLCIKGLTRAEAISSAIFRIYGASRGFSASVELLVRNTNA